MRRRPTICSRWRSSSATTVRDEWDWGLCGGWVSGAARWRPRWRTTRTTWWLRALTGAARGLGCELADLMMTLSFLALLVIPELRLTDQGLVDVAAFEVVPLIIE